MYGSSEKFDENDYEPKYITIRKRDMERGEEGFCKT